MFIVVAYDITADRRRTRLHKRLKSFGTAVQYSVFECVLDERQLREMKAMVRKIIHSREDLIRYYSLCESCRARVQTIYRLITTVAGTIVI
jgi:CRISPR-associated protein Cas2